MPSYATAAFFLWHGVSWANVFAPTILVGGLLQQFSYLSALVFQARTKVAGATAFDPGEPVVIAAYIAALVLLLRRVPPRSERRLDTPSARHSP